MTFMMLLLMPAALAAAGRDTLVFIGTYTGKGSQGIYSCRMDRAGKLSPPALAAETPSPSFLAIHPNRKFLYAVNEVSSFQGEKSGSVSAFSIDAASGKLTLLNRQPTRGTGPCYVSVDKSGRLALVANYGSGSVAALPIKADGSLEPASAFIQHTGSSVNPQRQRGPHAHFALPSTDNRFAVVADLGLDELLVYRLDPARGTLTPNEPPFAKVAAGAGPRHFAFQPKGKFAYAINEMASTVTAFSWDAAAGTLKEIATVTTLPKDFSGDNSGAEIEVHPNGRFVYASNRGHDSIAVFAIGAAGTLTPVEHASTQGKTPRNFAIDPGGRYLVAANQNSNNLVVFRVDPKTGRLTPTGQSVEVSMPVCVTFLPLD